MRCGIRCRRRSGRPSSWRACRPRSAGGARGEKLTAMCLRSLGRVRQLIEDHFLCERLDARGIPLQPEPTPLRALLEEVAGRRGLALAGLELDAPVELALTVDRALLERALESLVSIAGREGAKVRVGARGGGGRVVIRVSGAAAGRAGASTIREGGGRRSQGALAGAPDGAPHRRGPRGLAGAGGRRAASWTLPAFPQGERRPARPEAGLESGIEIPADCRGLPLTGRARAGRSRPLNTARPPRPSRRAADQCEVRHMSTGLLAKKMGMTQVFTPEGDCVPVTVLEAGPCTVVRRKTAEKDGYDAAGARLRSGRREARAPALASPRSASSRRPAPASSATSRSSGSRTRSCSASYKPGDVLTVDKVFKPAQRIDVSGVTKGRGFTGVFKKWGMKGAARDCSTSHEHHRHVGAIGAAQDAGQGVEGQAPPRPLRRRQRHHPEPHGDGHRGRQEPAPRLRRRPRPRRRAPLRQHGGQGPAAGGRRRRRRRRRARSSPGGLRRRTPPVGPLTGALRAWRGMA